MANLKRAEMEKAFKAADEIADAETAERLRLEKLVAQLEKKIERRDRMIDYYMSRVDGMLDPGHPDDVGE